MQYTDDKIKCGKCGKISLSSSRYCEICGNQLHIPLDSPIIKSEEFINIFNSAYSVIANKENPHRGKYITKNIEEYIFKRGDQVYHQLWNSVVDTRSNFKGLGDPFNKDIEPYIIAESRFCSSTTIAGYAFRIAEELYTQNNAMDISKNDINDLINNYKKNYIENQGSAEEDNFDILCFALFCDQNYTNFILLEKAKFDKYFNSFVGQSWEIELKIKNDLYTKLFRSNEIAHKYLANKKEDILGEIFNDHLYGYCLRIGSKLLSI